MEITLHQSEIEKAIVDFLEKKGVKGVTADTVVTIEQEGVNGSLTGVKAVINVESL